MIYSTFIKVYLINIYIIFLYFLYSISPEEKK